MTNDSSTDRARIITNRLRRWLLGGALPLWLDRGFGLETGMFHERLGFDASTQIGVPHRLMVQARQIYVYSHAIHLGWSDAAEYVRIAFESMIARYYRPDGRPGFVFSTDPSGKALDPKRDLYAHAFVLLAAAWCYRSANDSHMISLADEVLQFIDCEMRAPAGGYLDSIPEHTGTLRQNPIMHLFEALLALYEATASDKYLVRARDIHQLLMTRILIRESNIVAEYFDANWLPRGGRQAVWEPGHHFEWGWLLNRYQRLTGIDTRSSVELLVDKASRDGITSPYSIVSVVRADGAVADRTHRAWPFTEAAKAHAVRFEAGQPDGMDRAADALQCLSDRFLAPVRCGLWLDHVSEDWQPLHDYVPASTLYHLFLSVVEVDRILAGRRPRPSHDLPTERDDRDAGSPSAGAE